MEILPTLTAPIKGEVLVIYLAALTKIISVVLLAEREERQVLIYFVSRILQGAKLNYPALEKLILALVHAARRLQMRVAKWAIELGEHDIEFREHSSTKKQIPKDFSIEMPSKKDEKITARKMETKKEDPKLANIWNLYIDGASSFDGSGAGLMLINPEGKEYTYALHFGFETMDNEVGYEALLAGQIKGLFDARQPATKQYLEMAKEILKGFDAYAIEHIRRNQYKKADALSKLASMTFEHLMKEVLVGVLAKRSINDKEVSRIEAEMEVKWMTTIYEYLLSGLLLEDPKEARKIIIKAPQYKLIKRRLYKKYFLTPWLCCIGPSHTGNKEIHEGSCGFNTEPRSMVVKVMKQGYFWPSMHRDAAKIIQDCTPCQEYSTARMAMLI
ncbi:reverse transcriptase domain-containing protein [Tanacetum coccineum]